jgi:CheY-like chemotaxis protein
VKKAILVVEDNDDVRSALLKTLGYLGFQTEAATNGQEALEKLDGPMPIGLIILDLMMPVMNGWEFRSKQLAHPLHSKIPIIVVSANMNLQDEAEWLGANGILNKPVELQELSALIEQFCGEDFRAVASAS